MGPAEGPPGLLLRHGLGWPRSGEDRRRARDHTAADPGGESHDLVSASGTNSPRNGVGAAVTPRDSILFNAEARRADPGSRGRATDQVVDQVSAIPWLSGSPSRGRLLMVAVITGPVEQPARQSASLDATTFRWRIIGGSAMTRRDEVPQDARTPRHPSGYRGAPGGRTATRSSGASRRHRR